MSCKQHGPSCSGDHASDVAPIAFGINLTKAEERTPFRGARPTSDTPYWLRNGVADHAAVEQWMAEHRRRLGIGFNPAPTPLEAWKEKLAEERAVVDQLLIDISTAKISAVNALPALQKWRDEHDK